MLQAELIMSRYYQCISSVIYRIVTVIIYNLACNHLVEFKTIFRFVWLDKKRMPNCKKCTNNAFIFSSHHW